LPSLQVEVSTAVLTSFRSAPGGANWGLVEKPLAVYLLLALGVTCANKRMM
jgi:hypothetical protein